ncbi:MAG: hypothetical protein LAT67_13275 [Balneolales bacterium]|nr:hypothetical protein [Balneolales bacterium]
MLTSEIALDGFADFNDIPARAFLFRFSPGAPGRASLRPPPRATGMSPRWGWVLIL